KVWDAQTGQALLTLKGGAPVAFSPDGKTLASGSGDNTIKLWDAQTGQERATLKRHTHPVSGVAYSPDGRRIASGSGEKTVKVWDARTGQDLLTLKGHADKVSCVAFSPDGQRIASGSGGASRDDDWSRLSGGDEMSVKVWDVRTGEALLTLKGHTSFVS